MRSGGNIGRGRNGASRLSRYIPFRAKWVRPTLWIRPEIPVSQQGWWKFVPEKGLWNAYWSKTGLPFLSKFKAAWGFWKTTSWKPMRVRTSTNSYNFDVASWTPRLEGFTVTRNQSRFLETEGSLAWLSNCPSAHSPHHSINQFYDRIFILYESQIQCVDPVTEPTQTKTFLQNCTNRNTNPLQFYMDQKDLWNTLTLGISHQDRTAVFRPKDVIVVAVQSFPGSQDSGMYTRSELSSFRDSTFISAASRNALKKISQKLIAFSNNKGTLAVSPIMLLGLTSLWLKWSQLDTSRIDIWTCLDQSLMSLNNSKSHSSFLFFKFIIGFAVMVVRHWELIKRLKPRSGLVGPS